MTWSCPPVRCQVLEEWKVEQQHSLAHHLVKSVCIFGWAYMGGHSGRPLGGRPFPRPECPPEGRKVATRPASEDSLLVRYAGWLGCARFQPDSQDLYHLQHHIDGRVDPATLEVRKPLLRVADQACRARLGQPTLFPSFFSSSRRSSTVRTSIL